MSLQGCGSFLFPGDLATLSSALCAISDSIFHIQESADADWTLILGGGFRGSAPRFSTVDQNRFAGSGALWAYEGDAPWRDQKSNLPKP